MKSIKIKALFLASVIMVSFTATSISLFDNLLDNCDLIETSGEKEQNEENKSEEKESKDFLEEFVLHSKTDLFATKNKKSLYFIQNENFSYSVKDVVTPPPEYS